MVALPIVAQNEGEDTYLRRPLCIIASIYSTLFRQFSCMDFENLDSFQGRIGQESNAAHRDLRFYLHERLTLRREGECGV